MGLFNRHRERDVSEMDIPTRPIISEKEGIAAEEFRQKHRCKAKANRALILQISSTGIADNVRAVCPNCGKSKDVSDYDSW